MGIWEIYADVYDTVNLWLPYRQMLGEVLNEIPARESAMILDAGCGTGNLCRLLADKNPRARVTGIDFSPPMLANAAKNLKNTGVRLQRMDLNQTLAFDHDCFDCVVAVNSLYAVDSPSQVLKEFYRVLKPGGRLVIANPVSGAKAVSPRKRLGWDWSRMSSPKPLLDLPLLVLINMVIYLKSMVNRFHFIPEAGLQKILQEAGFKNIRFRCVQEDQSIIAVAHK